MAYVELIIREVRNEPNPLRIVVITNDTTYSHVASVSEFIFNLIMKLLGNKVMKYEETNIETRFKATGIDDTTVTIIKFIMGHSDNELRRIVDDDYDEEVDGISSKELYERILAYMLISPHD
ncbi:MAG: hypothetical protein QXM92_02520 [Candidatus Anstonellales archaeon]